MARVFIICFNRAPYFHIGVFSHILRKYTKTKLIMSLLEVRTAHVKLNYSKQSKIRSVTYDNVDVSSRLFVSIHGFLPPAPAGLHSGAHEVVIIRWSIRVNRTSFQTQETYAFHMIWMVKTSNGWGLVVHFMNGELRESEQVLFGLKSAFERDNVSLIVVAVALRFKFNAEESIGCGAGGPSCQGSNEWAGAVCGRGEWEVNVFWGHREEVCIWPLTLWWKVLVTSVAWNQNPETIYSFLYFKVTTSCRSTDSQVTPTQCKIRFFHYSSIIIS